MDLEFLWIDFMDHMDFLLSEKFVTEDGKLTEDGLWASKLRIDSPILVAQSIRNTLLPQSDPALLAAIVSSFVNEREFNDEPLYNKALPKGLKDVFQNSLLSLLGYVTLITILVGTLKPKNE